MRPKRYEFVGWENIEEVIAAASAEAVTAFGELISQLALLATTLRIVFDGVRVGDLAFTFFRGRLQ